MVYPRALSGKPTRPTLARMVGTYTGLVEDHSLPRTAAFFDLDKTVIAKSSTLTFSKSFYQGGLINRRAVLRTAYAQFVFMAGGADHDQMERMRAYLSALCRGWNVQQVKEIVAETLHDLIDPIIYDEAASLIEEHHSAGRDVVIVSTSGAEVVEPIGELLGAAGWWPRAWSSARTAASPGKWSTTRRSDEGRGGQGAGRVRGVRPRALLRLQRLRDRRSDAGGRRPSPCGESGPCAAARGACPLVADSGLRRPVRLKQRLPALSVPPRPGARRGGRDGRRRRS